MHTDDKPCSILCLGQFQMYALDIEHSNLLITKRVMCTFRLKSIIFLCAQDISLLCSRTCRAAVVGLIQIEDRNLFFVLQIRDRKLDLLTGS